MINDDILIKYSISEKFGGFNDWVSHVKYLSSQIREIRDTDFTGIGLNDLEIGGPKDVKLGSRIILCDYLDINGGDPENACILGLVTRISPEDKYIIELEIEGIGSRSDFIRDPDRKLRWGTIIYPDLRYYPCILFLVTKPRTDGGEVYYYYNKAARDSRVNYVPNHPVESKKAIIGALKLIAQEDIQCERERAQYMHRYRQICKELFQLLKETPQDDEIRSIINIFREKGRVTKENSKQLSEKLWEKLKEEKNCTKNILTNKN